MSRFDEEWALVPAGARWTAVLVCLVFAMVLAVIWLVPGTIEEGRPPLLLVAWFLVCLIALVPLALYVLLVGYVWGDAKRRGMRHLMWTLLAIFIPNAIGIILYFILRDPVPVPCPSCRTPATKGHVYCSTCGCPVRRACPHCGQPIEPGWAHCARCGATIAAKATA
jgi:hypothetical protein